MTFRSYPDGHGVHPTSSILVLASDDARTWEEVYRFRVDKRDTRDPHFLIFRDKLFVYTGTWYCGSTSPKVYEMIRHLGLCAWTEDGKTWSEPVMLEGTLAASPKSSLYWLIDDKLIEFAELPSAGDNSYPGFVALGPTEAIVSWYCSHETDANGKTITAIDLADVKVDA